MEHAMALPAGGVKLFKVFARMEYALKREDYFTNHNNRLSVDWQRFANERLGNGFLTRVRNEKLAPTILAHPPRRQSGAGGTFEFTEMPPPNTIQDFVFAVCRVRHNLFHGGKSHNSMSLRNRKLVKEANVILIEMLQECPTIRAHFENP